MRARKEMDAHCKTEVNHKFNRNMITSVASYVLLSFFPNG